MILDEAVALEGIERLTKDLKAAAVTLGRDEARFLVDAYYTMQENRIRAAGQVRALGESEEPHAVLTWYFTQAETLEKQVHRALDAYSGADPVGRWAREQKGIGPVISAGLLAHIDIEKAPTVGHIWSFAGLNPERTWEKGQKRPHNAALKTLCWKIGESFVKVSGHDDAFYGQVYAKRKMQEVERNTQGAFAEQAGRDLERKKYGKSTEAFKHYSAGRLSPAHLHARAKRYAVKLFLSHWHDVAYRERYGVAPPLPYPIAHLGHAHQIAVP